MKEGASVTNRDLRPGHDHGAVSKESKSDEGHVQGYQGHVTTVPLSPAQLISTDHTEHTDHGAQFGSAD